MLFGLFKTKNEKKLEELQQDVVQLARQLNTLKQQMHFVYMKYIDVPPEDVPFYMETRMSEDIETEYPLGAVINE